jgi:CoA:oxalate CoA-transferase
MLHGIRVLDLSRVIAGPYCAALLGDLGADVIKLERAGRGDDLRALRGSGRMSASFAAMNRNKRGIAVDLQKPEGARLGFELARRADVLIENFLPGVAERLGLGYAAVRAVNPRLVYASITGFGCGIGSCGVPRPSLADYVIGTGATRGAPAAGKY